ncbi:MAG: hypothetical protein V3V61_06675 [Gammaproteobacteria bacterium]
MTGELKAEAIVEVAATTLIGDQALLEEKVRAIDDAVAEDENRALLDNDPLKFAYINNCLLSFILLLAQANREGAQAEIRKLRVREDKGLCGQLVVCLTDLLDAKGNAKERENMISGILLLLKSNSIEDSAQCLMIAILRNFSPEEYLEESIKFLLEKLPAVSGIDESECLRIFSSSIEECYAAAQQMVNLGMESQFICAMNPSLTLEIVLLYKAVNRQGDDEKELNLLKIKKMIKVEAYNGRAISSKKRRVSVWSSAWRVKRCASEQVNYSIRS